MEAEVVVDDAMVDVVGLDQVLQCSRSLLRSFFDIVHVALGELDAGGEGRSPRRERRELDGQHRFSMIQRHDGPSQVK